MRMCKGPSQCCQRMCRQAYTRAHKGSALFSPAGGWAGPTVSRAPLPPFTKCANLLWFFCLSLCKESWEVLLQGYLGERLWTAGHPSPVSVIAPSVPSVAARAV